MDIETQFIILYACLLIAAVILIMSKKWITFAIKGKFLKNKWGEGNVGLLFERSLGNNFDVCDFVDLRDNFNTVKEKTRIYQREEFNQGTFFGFPYTFRDAQDTKTNYGLYQKVLAKLKIKDLPRTTYCFVKKNYDAEGNYKAEYINWNDGYTLFKAQSNENGQQVYHSVNTGIKDEAGQNIIIQTKIPMLDTIKSSVTLDPGLIRKAVVNMALSEAINEFLKKHKILLIVMGIAALGAGVAAFFSYNNQNAISSLCVQQLPMYKTQIIDACTTALQNLTKVVK